MRIVLTVFKNTFCFKQLLLVKVLQLILQLGKKIVKKYKLFFCITCVNYKLNTCLTPSEEFSVLFIKTEQSFSYTESIIALC